MLFQAFSYLCAFAFNGVVCVALFNTHCALLIFSMKIDIFRYFRMCASPIFLFLLEDWDFSFSSSLVLDVDCSQIYKIWSDSDTMLYIAGGSKMAIRTTTTCWPFIETHPVTYIQQRAAPYGCSMTSSPPDIP